jgi:hypothetical protein
MPKRDGSHRIHTTELPREREQPLERSTPLQQPSFELGLPGWVVSGLVVAGLGLLAWQYLGPDLRRYLKIRSM